MKKNKRRSPEGIIIVCAAFVVTVLFIQDPPTKRRGLPEKLISSAYSQEEMDFMWTNHFATTVIGLFSSNAPPAIQRRFSTLADRIYARYGERDINLNLNPGYMPESKSIRAGASIKNGKPAIHLIIPRLIDEYKAERLLGEDGLEIRIRCTLLISVMHELEHLAAGDPKEDGRANPVPLEKLVEVERRAWADTCKYTIVPLVEQHNFSLGYNEKIFYEQWVKAGRDLDSPVWRRFIHNSYKRTR